MPATKHAITFDAIDSILPRYITGIYYLRGVSKTHFGQAGVLLARKVPLPGASTFGARCSMGAQLLCGIDGIKGWKFRKFCLVYRDCIF